MGSVCILAPVVIAGWPAFSAAAVSASLSLGYHVVSELKKDARATVAPGQSNDVQLEKERSEPGGLPPGREQRLAVTRGGVAVTFALNARGQASLCVTGNDESEEALRALGEELRQRVVQRYVYKKLTDEMRAHGFVVAAEEEGKNRAIHLKVRHREG